jgi:tripartite-type tricarboxylate transporter receptor subunit TctC
MRQVAASALALLLTAATACADDIVLRGMGSLHVGGRIVEVHGKPIRDIVRVPGGPSSRLDPNGQYQVEQMYVQYFLPKDRKGKVPLLMWHGGGLTGVTYETTPDGREGWLNMFVRKGWDVYVSDAVERGRSGFASPDVWPGEPIFLTYADPFERFRIGEGEGSWNPDPTKQKLMPGMQFLSGVLRIASCHVRPTVAGIGLLLAGLVLAPRSCFAEFPERPIHVIVPFPPGGAVDLVTRLVTQRITEARGWSFSIENKAAAGAIVATDAVAKAAGDGYTLLMATPNYTISAALKSRLPYDWERDVVPVSVIAEVPELLVSHPAAPFDSFAGFIAYARENPGKLNYSSAGSGTLPHLTMELLLRRAGVEAVHVPYRGAAPAMTDLLAGVVQLKLDTYATSNDHVAAGKLRALAIASTRRSSLMPQLSTIAEQGFPGYEGIWWIGLMAPVGVPAGTVDLLVAATSEAVRSEGLVERLKRAGIEPVGNKAAEFGVLIANEVAQWRDLAKAVRITVD